MRLSSASFSDVLILGISFLIKFLPAAVDLFLKSLLSFILLLRRFKISSVNFWSEWLKIIVINEFPLEDTVKLDLIVLADGTHPFLFPH